jgi:hypothetical protein
MLKKFTEFASEKCNISKEEKNDYLKNPTDDIKNTKKTTAPPIVKDPKPEIEESKMESFKIDGKIVNFSNCIKPSISIVMLENNKISKDKLHYIISEQTKNSLVVLKYNEKAEIKLTDFANTLITYYKKNINSKNIFDNIIVEGSEQFSIIKNIPDINIGNKKLIQLLKDDFIKLLK